MPGDSSSIFLVKNSSGAVLLLLACRDPFVGSELMSMQLSVFQLRIQSKLFFLLFCICLLPHVVHGSFPVGRLMKTSMR